MLNNSRDPRPLASHLQAAAHGVPTVATKNGGPVDIMATLHHGLLVDPTDPADIADKMLKILTNPQLWEQFSHNGADPSSDCPLLRQFRHTITWMYPNTTMYPTTLPHLAPFTLPPIIRMRLAGLFYLLVLNLFCFLGLGFRLQVLTLQASSTMPLLAVSHT